MDSNIKPESQEINEELNNEELENQEEEDNKLMYIYEWVDSIPLSRQKKNISRDFSDGVLLAEMIKYHFPRLVDIHNYPGTSNTKQKYTNWETLDKKVLKRIGLKITKQEIDDIIKCKPNAIEKMLAKVYKIIHVGEVGKNDEPILEDSELKDDIDYKSRSKMELLNIIKDKNQEISKLKNYIEDLEKRLKESNQMQKQLNSEIRDLTKMYKK